MIEKTFSILKANLLSIPFSVFVVGVVFMLYFEYSGNAKDEMAKLDELIILLIFFVCMFIHELIHGLFFAKYNERGFKSIQFGIKWRGLAPFCHCKEAVQVHNYRIAIIMPTVLLGFLPLIVGFFLENVNVVGIATLMIIAGIGDFISLWMLKDLKKDVFIYDHPSKLGFMYKDE